MVYNPLRTPSELVASLAPMFGIRLGVAVLILASRITTRNRLTWKVPKSRVLMARLASKSIPSLPLFVLNLV